jgi:hypothetical protein
MELGDFQDIPTEEEIGKHRKPRRHWIVRRLRRINTSQIATNTLRYAVLPATMYWILYHTDPEPDVFSLFNPFF